MADGSLSYWRDAALVPILGAHAQEFLQGYLTSSTDRLVPGTALPMALCNLKGRVVASGWAIEIQDGIGLIVHACLTQAVRDFLKPYVTFSKCELGATDRPVLISSTPDEDGTIELVPGLMVLAVDDNDQGLADGSAHALELLTDAAFAFVSAPVTERFLPQMLGLHEVGAVDFDKGCYLGQEIVARAQFRGAVKRHLDTFKDVTADTMPGTELDDSSVVVQAANGRALVVTSV